MLKRAPLLSVAVAVCALGAAVFAQQATFDGAVADIRAGDFLRALAALNELAKQAPPSQQAAIHAYRALAYARMDQADRARGAAAQALQLDPMVAAGPPDFPPDVSAMFDRLRNLTPAELEAFSAAARPAPAPAPTPVAASPPPSTPAPAPPAAAGFGTLVIYRPSNFVGSARRMKIECSGVKVADLQNGRVVRLKVASGTHHFEVQDKAATVDVVPGAEYFFRASMAGGSLRVMPADEGRADIKERNMKPNDTEKIYFEECK